MGALTWPSSTRCSAVLGLVLACRRHVSRGVDHRTSQRPDPLAGVDFARSSFWFSHVLSSKCRAGTVGTRDGRLAEVRASRSPVAR